MFSYVLSAGKPFLLLQAAYQSHTCRRLVAASTYFHLPVDEQEDRAIESCEQKHITRMVEPPGPSSSIQPSVSYKDRSGTVNQVLSNDNLYEILGLSRSSSPDRSALRRAYLSRSKACHPESVLLPLSLCI
jgi:hypothetical protein